MRIIIVILFFSSILASELLYDVLLINDFEIIHVDSPIDHESENSDKNEKEANQKDDVKLLRNLKGNMKLLSIFYKSKNNSNGILLPQFCKRIPVPPPDSFA